MHVVFVGEPNKEDIRNLIIPVMNRYNMEITDDKILNVANMLVALRQSSKTGVTEMQLLENIFKYGSSQIKLPEQAALSFTLLEK